MDVKTSRTIASLVETFAHFEPRFPQVNHQMCQEC